MSLIVSPKTLEIVPCRFVREKRKGEENDRYPIKSRYLQQYFNLTKILLMVGEMAEKEKKDLWVKVKDDAGNEFICPINALKDRESATEEELENCVEDAVAGRYAGNIAMED